MFISINGHLYNAQHIMEIYTEDSGSNFNIIISLKGGAIKLVFTAAAARNTTMGTISSGLVTGSGVTLTGMTVVKESN